MTQRDDAGLIEDELAPMNAPREAKAAEPSLERFTSENVQASRARNGR